MKQLIKVSNQLIPFGKKRTGKKMKPKYITIHSTGNPKSTVQNERDYLTNPINTNSTGYHYVVGEDKVICCIPPTEIAYHAGDGYDGVGNTQSIGIEMVETGDREKVLENTRLLTLQLMAEFDIDVDNVVRHHDWSGKHCPRILAYDDWQGWRDWITGLYEVVEGYSTIKLPTNEPSPWAKESWFRAVDKNIVDGKRPKEPMTREEVVVVLHRLGVI